jgi:hypothetical protein
MIIEITKDKEKAKSILNMAKQTEDFIKEIFKSNIVKNHQSIIAEKYYDIIRSLATGLFLCKGFKSIGKNSHKETIDFLANFKEISAYEIEKIKDLRIRRNKSSYEGKPIKSPYLENNKEDLDLIISKLKGILANEFQTNSSC